MTKIEDFITINQYSRPAKKLVEVKAIVLHWTAMPNQSCKGTRDYYEGLKDSKDVYGSAHYVVKDTEIRQCIPDTEVAYHCGTSKPLSDTNPQVYTDYARQKFDKYCIDYKNNSPNNVTIGIEMSPIDLKGHFSYDTWKTTKELVIELLAKFKLLPSDITYHSRIIGTNFKKCPQLFVDHPDEFDRFVKEVVTVTPNLYNIRTNTTA